MEMRETEAWNSAQERTHLLENLRSSENRELEKIAKQAMEDPNTEIDRVYPRLLNKTLLDVACCEGHDDVAKRLLKLGADPNRKNEAHNRGPLHFAAEAGHQRVLEILLDDPRTRVNLRIGEQTALHIAVRQDKSECVDVLLRKGLADPNIVNSKGVTPFHVAATTENRQIIGIILRASRVPVDVDGHRDSRGRTSREIVLERMPDLAAQLPPLTLNAESGNSRVSNETKVEIDFADNEIEEALKSAAERDLPEMAAKLTEKGRALFSSEDFGEAAAVIAVQLAHHRVLKKILALLPGLANRLLLPACREFGVPSLSGRKDNRAERLECFRLIMKNPDVNVRCEDDKGNTPLHYAARAEYTEAVETLLNAGSYIGHRNVLGFPPLAHLSPSFVSNFFDRCLYSDNDRTDEYEIEFDYRCLTPWSTDGHAETETLTFMAKSRALKSLLTHPLLSSYLYLKWHRLRHLLYANFVLYAVFYILMNLYVITSDNRQAIATHRTVSTSGNLTLPINSSVSYPPLASLTAVALVLLVIREILQFASSPWSYVKSLENIFEISLMILSGWIIVSWNPRIGAIVVLLSAWELVVLIGQHPRISTGVEMFKTVSRNFARFLCLYAFLILAFALAFFTLFRDTADDENFPDPGHSLFKTIIMLTGEFDADDIPFVSHPVLSRAIFLLFVFLIAIVLFNLLNGLAVSDTADILKRSELVGLVSRVRLVSYVENVTTGLSGLEGNEGSSIRRKLLAPFARRVFLAPVYLPQAKIAVKPYKSNEIKLRGRADRTKNCAGFFMDPLIVERATNILSRRGVKTDNDKIMDEFQALKRKIENLEDSVSEVRRELAARNGSVDFTARRE